MSLETETIDRLFLELSQITKAQPYREDHLVQALLKIVQKWGSGPKLEDVAIVGSAMKDIANQAITAYFKSLPEGHVALNTDDL